MFVVELMRDRRTSTQAGYHHLSPLNSFLVLSSRLCSPPQPASPCPEHCLRAHSVGPQSSNGLPAQQSEATGTSRRPPGIPVMSDVSSRAVKGPSQPLCCVPADVESLGKRPCGVVMLPSPVLHPAGNGLHQLPPPSSHPSPSPPPLSPHSHRLRFASSLAFLAARAGGPQASSQATSQPCLCRAERLPMPPPPLFSNSGQAWSSSAPRGPQGLQSIRADVDHLQEVGKEVHKELGDEACRHRDCYCRLDRHWGHPRNQLGLPEGGPLEELPLPPLLPHPSSQLSLVALLTAPLKGEEGPLPPLPAPALALLHLYMPCLLSPWNPAESSVLSSASAQCARACRSASTSSSISLPWGSSSPRGPFECSAAAMWFVGGRSPLVRSLIT